MNESIKNYTELEKYEIININDGEKFNCLGNNDIIIDEKGNFKLLLLSDPRAKLGIFSKTEYIEVPLEAIKKIGSKTIIIDADEKQLKRAR